MKIGVRTVCLRQEWDEVLPFCEQIGLDGIQVAPMEHGLLETSVSEREEFADRVRSYGLEISATSAGPNLVDPRIARESIARYKEMLKLAVDLGPGIVTGEVKAVPPGLSEEEAWSTCIASVKEVCAYAADIGARYAVEPGAHCLVKNGDDLLRLLEAVDSDRCGVNFDPANVNSAGADPVADARKVAQHLLHTHAKDSGRASDGTSQETVLGEGDVDFPELIRAYREAGFDGWLCIERERSDRAADDVHRSKVFLGRILKR